MDRATGQGRDYEWLRQWELLSRGSSDAGADGGIPGERTDVASLAAYCNFYKNTHTDCNLDKNANVFTYPTLYRWLLIQAWIEFKNMTHPKYNFFRG
jgi:hypothetical protein